MPCALFCARASRLRLEVLLQIHLAVRFPIPRQLVLPILEDLVNLVGFRVHAPGSYEVDFGLFLVGFWELSRRTVSMGEIPTTKLSGPHYCYLSSSGYLGIRIFELGVDPGPEVGLRPGKTLQPYSKLVSILTEKP